MTVTLYDLAAEIDHVSGLIDTAIHQQRQLVLDYGALREAATAFLRAWQHQSVTPADVRALEAALAREAAA